jgi:hypothetical protein
LGFWRGSTPNCSSRIHIGHPHLRPRPPAGCASGAPRGLITESVNELNRRFGTRGVGPRLPLHLSLCYK